MAARRTTIDGSTPSALAHHALLAFAAVLLLLLAGWQPAAAQPDDAAPAASADKPPSTDGPPSADKPAAEEPVPLATQERQVLDRFSELEKKLLRMAELTAATDPHRAALLRKAVAQSQQQGIESQLSQLVELLGQDRLAPAIKGEASLEQDLAHLLELLSSEDRSKRLQSEKERISKYIQRVNKLIKEQKQLQGQSAGDANLADLAEGQGKLAEKTSELARDLAESDAGKKSAKKPADKSREGKPGQKNDKSPRPEAPADDKPDNEPAENQPGDDNPTKDGSEKDKPAKEKSPKDKPGKEKAPTEKPDKPGDAPSEGGDENSGDQNSNGQKPPGDKNSGEKPAGDPANPSESDPAQKPADGGEPSGEKPSGEKSDGQPSDAGGEKPQSPQQTPDEPPAEQDPNDPVRERVAQAEKKMREAQERLAEALRDKAVEKQEEAKRELELAKAELEAILRQLREEEIGRTLAMLESRFRKMLDMQNQVNTGTRRLDKIPQDQRDHDDEIEAGRLSRQEATIVDEANKALAVLHDEGSAVAFPEAVTDLRDDMEQVVVRLAQAKVDALTQGLEDDIVVALEEMITALHGAQKDKDTQQVNKPQGAQSGEDNEKPLVDDLSEIRMIRSMQMWVNQRTRRFTDMAKTDSAVSPDLIAALRRLAEREERIRRVTRDIVVGRNK